MSDTLLPETDTDQTAPDQSVRKRSVRLFGHMTSVSMEPLFWDELHRLADRDGVSLTSLIERIDSARTTGATEASTGSLSSALRLYILCEVIAERDRRD